MLSAGARKLLAMRQLAQTVRKFSDHHVVPEKFKHLQRLHMDVGYPVPKELYVDAYARQQKKNNAMLIFSVIFLASAVAYTTASDTFDFLAPPPREVKNWK
ncbi:hypothetical protein TYRP_008457 [Tyrophagus putrescentiae]|nr:hypothetical protein TYRP_008457 [Tyrophagus putrescentiae]